MLNHSLILLIEDDPVDALNTQNTIKTLEHPFDTILAKDCEEALTHLQGGTKPLPRLIFLNLDSSHMSGLEFLKRVKSSDSLRYIPIVVLSRHNDEHRIAASYGLGAAGYILKSSNYDEMSEEIGIIVRYWSLSLLPTCRGEFVENTYTNR